MRRIKENIAYAKSILNKNGITNDSDEYKDYLTIREICGKNLGYVGILTKIRFIDGIDDMDEIQSIFDILKNSKIDVNKISKLSYDDILSMFYDELDLSNKGDKDLELIFKDDQYSYYRVYTYEGILKIGSPSWCLKTKSNWDKYQDSYPDQWVVIDNRHLKGILTPNNNYLETYRNTKKPWVRYGVSLVTESDNSVSWVANDDNNNQCKFDPLSWTFFGVLCTIINLNQGVKKSYYEKFKGCEQIDGTWHKVIDKSKFLERMNRGTSEKIRIDDDYVVYTKFSKTYSYITIILLISTHTIKLVYPTNKSYNKAHTFNKPGTITQGGKCMELLLDFMKDEDDPIFDGIKLSRGLKSIEEIESNSQFLKKVGKWLIFNRNKYYYLIVNSDLVDLDIPTCTKIECFNDLDEPMYWYLDKDTFKPVYIGEAKIRDFHSEVIDVINREGLGIYIPDDKDTTDPTEVKEDPKVGGFWDFLKRRK